MIKKVRYVFRYIFKIKMHPRIRSKSFVILHKGVQIIVEKGGALEIGERVCLKADTTLYVKESALLSIGNNTSTGHNTEISAGREILIGSNVIMGAYTYITDSNHSYNDSDKLIKSQPMNIGCTKIGNNVWLGRNAFVLKGAEISDRTVVGALSLVKGKFEGSCVIAGNPAKVVRVMN